MTLRWRTLSDTEREREYSPSSRLPDGDYRPFVDDYRRRSDEAWAALDASATATTTVVTYGPSPAQTIDLAVPAVAGPDTPLLVFFHGGYWQELSKLDSRFAAPACLDRGWAFAAVDYPLAPEADVITIVDECRAAFRTLQATASTLGFDPDHITVTGSSAGAHLAAMVTLDPDRDRDRPGPAAAVLVSGIYELAPLIGTSIDAALCLDPSTAARNSPLRADLTGFPSTVVAIGADETSEFKAQSSTFAAALGQAGTPVTAIEVAGRNHFDVILDLAEPGTVLGEATAGLIEATLGPGGAHRG